MTCYECEVCEVHARLPEGVSLQAPLWCDTCERMLDEAEPCGIEVNQKETNA